MKICGVIKQNPLRAMQLVCLLAVMTGPTYAANWANLSGAETLRELVSGARAEIDLMPGVTATGEYNADGSAKIEAWGETFPRTWEVRGDDQVCYLSATETNCYTYEQNLDAPGEYRARHVETGQLTVFRVSGTDPRIVNPGWGAG